MQIGPEVLFSPSDEGQVLFAHVRLYSVTGISHLATEQHMINGCSPAELDETIMKPTFAVCTDRNVYARTHHPIDTGDPN